VQGPTSAVLLSHVWRKSPRGPCRPAREDHMQITVWCVIGVFGTGRFNFIQGHMTCKTKL